ncbi:MAG: alpha/beta hydrolase [Gammaproteobacteria bacterium]|nr:alpha/beta hydrolase [Gammaproteobacteria bacterium]
MHRIIFILLSTFFYISAHAAHETNCVVLLHGLGRSHHAMSGVEATLKKHHYLVVNQSYPSTKLSINTLANQYIEPMINQCLAQQPKHIMFITHSLGGIILEKYLENHTIPRLSRIVMLSPPHHGSPLADLLHHTWLFQKIMGPAGQELTTHLIHTPPHSKVQLGIIAGSFNLIPFSNYFFHGKNDGKVSISSAKTERMTDFIVLPVNHTFMMNNYFVQQQILTFLYSGKFLHSH